MARVLIVDDSPEFRLPLGKDLQRSGHAVSFADDGNDALRVLQNETVDLVLLDFHMPLWDGVESMVLFKQNKMKPRVIAYTCKSRDNSTPFETVMTTLGAAAAVRCGKDPAELLKTVHRFLGDN